MSDSLFSIREITPEDNPKVELIIKSIFPEFGLPLTGTAYEDDETPKMFEAFQSDKEIYFVAIENGEVVGGAGIKQLRDEEPDICELQKMYFKPSARGKGYGKLIFEQCLKTARAMGYSKCYLESASQLKIAISIYEKSGFVHLDNPMGNTGHYSCGVWMIKDL
ncbi:MAG: GNAT family N-acetyltransferase [Flavobacteriaceae bacterium]|nr:GNAT family N-acetyltransferase [Bacteroidia bacterium]MBT8288247.1 GNAT family N-acetyltransferase [Bacteroidia bacterium]NNF74791.1 GNAT family N-acetyltransferase [Flavobacteriaceae bacterium]NNK74178.1 GNAT family N-acetyltransferase [Flavobacteriaceae bacterium]